MNWSDERYVKLYQRKTATWLLWPWQARAVFPLMLKEADGAGLIEVGPRDPINTLAVLIGVPAEVVEPAVRAMIDTETVEHAERGFLLTNYIEAQEATKTESRRKQDQRERQRAQVRANTRAPVTRSHAVSRGVTGSHGVSPSSPAQITTSPDHHQPTTSPPPPPAQDDHPPQQAALLEVPVSESATHAQRPERQLTFVQRLHAEFCEHREHKIFELTGELEPAPDDPPNWNKTSLVAQQWLDFVRKAFPDNDAKENELCVRDFVLSFLEDPWGAGLMKLDAKGNPTDTPHPFPWRALTSEKVWRKLADAYVADFNNPRTESAA